MAPMRKVDVVDLKVVYDPSAASGHDHITVSSSPNSQKGALSTVRQWFEDVTAEEVASFPPIMSTYFKEWEVKTSNPNVFLVKDVLYDKIFLVFGNEKIHWIYYTSGQGNKQRIFGSSDLTFSFCGCCLHKQYSKILDIVQENANNSNRKMEYF